MQLFRIGGRVTGRYAAAGVTAVLLATGAVPVGGAPARAATLPSFSDAAYVRLVGIRDSRRLVRTYAWQALLSPDPEAASSAYLRTSYPTAKALSDNVVNRNLDFCERVRDTYRPEYSPQVHAAALWAIAHGNADRDAFVRTGFTAAKAADKQAREQAADAADAVAQADRDFVAAVRDAPSTGSAARAAADYALRPVATDADVREFFAGTWPDAAKADRDLFRKQATDADVAVRTAAQALVLKAQAAAAAAEGLEGEARQAQLDAAAQAWGEVAASANTRQSAWTSAEGYARTQVSVWQEVVAQAARSGESWAGMFQVAGGEVEDWTAERDWAQEQAGFWALLLEQATAAEGGQ